MAMATVSVAEAPLGLIEREPELPDRPCPTALEELEERFILHWGEMAGAWGINRTMGQIHALLYITGRPLCTDDIMARLGISRGNANMNLRELMAWGLIRRVHRTGERKEYFQSECDVWEMFRTIMRERKRREFDPTMHLLRQCLSDSEMCIETSRGYCPSMSGYHQRIATMLDLLEKLDSLCARYGTADPEHVARLLEVPVEGL
jgi:DNA-binding transcriptional regulator GbsR (MarR family)